MYITAKEHHHHLGYIDGSEGYTLGCPSSPLAQYEILL